jgi:negative regulator of flagellin synthesis FlgM
MRVGLFNSTASELASELSSQQVGAKNSAKANSAAQEDRATLTSGSTTVSSLVSKALESPEVRQDKVDNLRQAVESGQYKVEPDKIASSILDNYA